VKRRRSTWRRLALGVAFACSVGAASCSTGGAGADAGSDGAPVGQQDGPVGARDAKHGIDARFVSHDAGSNCGGRTGNPCGDGARCMTGLDCQSGLCVSAVCTAPEAACTDGMKSGQDTDVDCGGPVCPACGTGKHCKTGTDCQSLVCVGGVCQAATDKDSVRNDSETDVDCGGALQNDGTPNPVSDGAPPCRPGKLCVIASDCIEAVCGPNAVVLDAGTTGMNDAAVTVGDASAGFDATDASRVTSEAGAHDAGSGGPFYCQPATDDDGIQNDSESAVDCGGGFLASGAPNPASDGAPACKTGKTCSLGSDCVEGVCNANENKGGGPINCPADGKGCKCQVPAGNDGVKNDSETDVDCGGATSPGSDGAGPCGTGMDCNVAADCASGVCGTSGSPGGVCAAPTPTDGVQNDSETDVDCGGALLSGGAMNGASDGAPPCADAKKCGVDTDCLSGFCSLISKTCVDGQSCKGLATAATIMDLTGTVNPNMTVTTAVDANGDAVGVPDPNGVGQSAGLDTCGSGEATDPIGMQHHESCCKSLLLPGSTTLRMDKYLVTSGRIRQFLQSLNYDVRDWAFAQFDATLNPITPAGTMMASQLPVNAAGATNALTFLPKSNDTTQPLNAVVETGALVLDTSGVQGCYTADGAGGAATYWWDAPTLHDLASSPPRPFTQDYYDIKPMNCIPYFLAVAFCAWDGGRVMLQAEHTAAWGAAAYPWGPALIPSPYPGNQAITSDAACMPGVPNGAVNCTIDWFDGGQASGSQGNFYLYPSFINNVPNQFVPDSLSNTLDLSVYIAPPGRFFLDRTTVTSTSFGDGEGWQDLGALMLELSPYTSAVTGSGQFCDESGVLGPGEVYNCGSSGVLRGSGLPNVDILGGSWEGHGPTENYCTNCWSTYRQYGKTGVRCVRPAEPAP